MCAIPEVQFNVYFTDCLTQRLCHEESKWKCKELMSGGGGHGPACCGRLSASASPVTAAVASQPGAAGLGQSATPLLSPGSGCHIFDSLVALKLTCVAIRLQEGKGAEVASTCP